MSCDTKRLLLIAAGAAVAVAACIPFLEPARIVLLPLGTGLIGLGMKAPGHGERKEDSCDPPAA